MRLIIRCGTLSAAVVLFLALTGCDSAGESPLTDVEKLVGTWAITGFVDDTGDRSDIIAKGFAGVHMEFAEGGTGSLDLFPKQGPARRLSSSYSVDEEVDLISATFAVSIDALLALELAYSLSVDGQRVQFHTTNSDELNTLFEADLTGDVKVVASKFGEDGMTE